MSGDHGHDSPFDAAVGFHPSAVADRNRPVFDEQWQRRAFGLAVALAEFGHYDWADFQQRLISAIGEREDAPYYENWVAALGVLVRDRGMLDDGYPGPAGA